MTGGRKGKHMKGTPESPRLSSDGDSQPKGPKICRVDRAPGPMWVQEAVGGKPAGDSFKVTPVNNDIDSLKDAIKVKWEANYDTKINALTLTIYFQKKVKKSGSTLDATTPGRPYTFELVRREALISFDPTSYNFVALVNGVINNKTDTTLLERTQPLDSIISDSKSLGLGKPIWISLFSGRGSGKTSLLRQLLIATPDFSEARACGRLLIFDWNSSDADLLCDRLKRDKGLIHFVLPVLIVVHLCRVFGNATVEGVTFSAQCSFCDLWSSVRNPTSPHRLGIPDSLLRAVEALGLRGAAHSWWCTMTNAAFGLTSDVRPMIFFDTAEFLAVAVDAQSPPVSQDDTSANLSPRATGTPTADTMCSPRTHTPRTHTSENNQQERYLYIEWIAAQVPVHDVLISVGTGEKRNCQRPTNFQTMVDHRPQFPLQALSFKSCEKLQEALGDRAKPHNNPRFLRAVYTMTAGVPRMVMHAFRIPGETAAIRHSKWEEEVRRMYRDVDALSQSGDDVAMLSTAIVMCATFDSQSTEQIPNTHTTLLDLQRLSIVFQSDQGCCIPRLLWSSDRTILQRVANFVKDRFHFNIEDLVPTVNYAFSNENSTAPTSAGKFWERVFAAFLVARFHVRCLKKSWDPATTDVPLSDLVLGPAWLSELTVCLPEGVNEADPKHPVFANSANVNPKQVHLNYSCTSAHHDLVLPVKKKNGNVELWGVSAREGTHKTEKELIDTKQHLVSKVKGVAEVDGVLQACNPRLKPVNSSFKKKFKELAVAKRYAEVRVPTSQVSWALWCFE